MPHSQHSEKEQSIGSYWLPAVLCVPGLPGPAFPEDTLGEGLSVLCTEGNRCEGEVVVLKQGEPGFPQELSC